MLAALAHFGVMQRSAAQCRTASFSAALQATAAPLLTMAAAGKSENDSEEWEVLGDGVSTLQIN